MHPLRIPIRTSVEDDGSTTISGTIPALDTWERIRVNALEVVPRGAGCYALYQKGKLIYIGESSNLNERLSGHNVSFDEAAWLRLDGAQRLFVEKILIWRFMPEENNELKRHDYRMKIKEEVLDAQV